MIASAAYAFIKGKKVAGLYDHSSARDLQIAAESRGRQLQGYDGDRAVKFGGTLPEMYDTGEGAFVSLEIDGAEARGYDRGSSSHYAVKVADQLVQLYDHGESTWFAFDVQEV